MVKLKVCCFNVVTSDDVLFHGNDWYSDNMVNQALLKEIIQKEDVKYQIKASAVLVQDHFTAFVNDIFEKFYEPKQAIVGFIGAMFGRSYTTYNRDYFESNLDTVLQHYINDPDHTNIRGIYNTNNTVQHCGNNVLDMNYTEFSNELMASISLSSNEVPITYHINIHKKHQLYVNALFIQRNI